MIRLQRCDMCGAAQYPPHELCVACLSDRLGWIEAEALPARVLAGTVLHHSNEARFRSRLPMKLGLVQFQAGPVAVCFLGPTAQPDGPVKVRTNPDGLLEAE